MMRFVILILVAFVFNNSFAAEQVCGYPGLPVNARFTDVIPESDVVFPVGTVITYECENSMRLIGDLQRRCDLNGKWSGSVPICVNIDDLFKEFDSYQDFDPSLNINEIVDYVKSSSVDSPTPCGTPDIPARGKSRYITSESGTSYVVYTCQLGYFLHGSSLRTCGKDKKWTGIQPRCVQMKTNPPTDNFPAESDSSMNKMNSDTETENDSEFSDLSATLNTTSTPIVFILIISVIALGMVLFAFLFFIKRNGSNSLKVVFKKLKLYEEKVLPCKPEAEKIVTQHV